MAFRTQRLVEAEKVKRTGLEMGFAHLRTGPFRPQQRCHHESISRFSGGIAPPAFGAGTCLRSRNPRPVATHQPLADQS